MEDASWLAGHFLISSPNLFDPNFFRAVVLLVRHNEEGAFGLVLNRPARTLGEMIPELKGEAARGIPLYSGGPVQQNFLFALHSGFSGREAAEAARLVPGLTFEPVTHELLRYIEEDWEAAPDRDRQRIRLYAGYAGWAENQLERELRRHAWFTHPANDSIVFHPDADAMWKAALSKKGEYYRLVADTGYIPSVN